MDLATSYLGLSLRSPFVIGASPFGDEVEVARRLEEGGAGALVMRSLFEEQIEPRFLGLQEPRGEYVDTPAGCTVTPGAYLHQIERLKQSLSIPVIASLNGHKPGGWTSFARSLEWAGADAIELNFYRIVTDSSVAADQVETEMLETVGMLTDVVRIPVAVKLSPFHTSLAQLAVALELEGVAGLVLFNRFYQPDIGPADLGSDPLLQLSEPSELLLRLHWLAILAPQLRCSLSAGGGVHTPEGALKALLAGADTIQIVSVLLKHGPRALSALVGGMEAWMERHGYENIAQFRGSLNAAPGADPGAAERSNYIRTLQTWKM